MNARVADGVAAHVTTSLRGEGTMPVYLVERALPGVTLAQLTAIRRAGEEMCHRFARDGKAVHYRRSIFVPGESRCLCLFDAQDADRVQEVNEAAQIPYGRIVLAVDLALTPPRPGTCAPIRPHKQTKESLMTIVHTRTRRLYSALILSGMLALLPLIPQALGGAQADDETPRYVVTDLGTLGGPFSQANAINNRGQIVGLSLNATPDPTNPSSTETRAFLWQHGIMTDLGTLGGPDALGTHDSFQGGTGINDRGQITGGASYNAVIDPDPQCPGACSHAFLWQRGTMTSLGTLGGLTSLGNTISAGSAVNQRGQVVGGSLTTIPFPSNPAVLQSHAFLWDGGVMTDLGTLSGIPFSLAFALNNGGQVVGESVHPFLWSSGVMTDLGTFGGPRGFALSINDQGQVVGGADTTTPDPTNPNVFLEHAFVWSKGQLQDLGVYPGDPGSNAYGINNRGQIVGFSGDDAAIIRALLWQGGAVFDLNTLIPASSGWTLLQASAINDRGQIVGWGINPQGQADAFLLTPVQGEEPAAAALSAAALQARTQAALARLPATVRASLERSGPGRVETGE